MVSDFRCGGRCRCRWHDEFFQIAEYATPEPILSQVAKEAFPHIEPRRAGGSEVQMKTRMACQPALHFGMPMSRVVIADQVQLPVGRNRLVDQTEKLEPFLMAMPLLAKAKDLAVGRIQRGEQKWPCRCVCNRASWWRRVRASAAGRVGYDPRLEFGSSRRRTTPARAPAD